MYSFISRYSCLRKGMMVKKMKLRSGFPSHKVIISLACSPCNGGKARVYMYRTTTHEVCGLDFEQSFFSVRTVKQSAQDARTSPSEFMLESRLYLKTQANKRVYSYFEKGCRKNVHATIPKGNMGYDQYSVPDDCTCRTYFCCFPLALANTFPRPFVPILSNFFK